ncbi:MAG: peptide chain release factor-like protein [Deltaproteobacteria bacterium]|nr:peptide chain release factor-like protein [Deltaproteobacteria bacterium]
MPLFPVSPAKQQLLLKEMEKYQIREEDLVEKFIRGSGAGGQKINKTSSCVQLAHTPTGLEVRCQTSRSQSLNRFYARRLLVEKIAQQIEGKKSTLQQRIEKIRRQKRRRSKRAKEKMLENKKHQGMKKSLRKISPEEF